MISDLGTQLVLFSKEDLLIVERLKGRKLIPLALIDAIEKDEYFYLHSLYTDDELNYRFAFDEDVQMVLVSYGIYSRYTEEILWSLSMYLPLEITASIIGSVNLSPQ